MSSLNPTLITFLFYIVAMIVIGLMAYRATANFSDYILGGRRLGSFVTALSAGASDMSGWLLMGLPGAIYLSGRRQLWQFPGALAGSVNYRALWQRQRSLVCACGTAGDRGVGANQPLVLGTAPNE